MTNMIKTLRKQSGFTQTQLGDYLGVEQSMIAKIEKGERNLTTVQLKKLADLFACSEDYILGIETSANPMKLAFRIDEPDIETMNTIASVNRVASNLKLLKRILEVDDAK